METSVTDVYAAGDIASFPLSIADDNLVNIGHWQLACKLGQVAAKNMAGHPTQVHTVPFFWSVMFGKSLRYAGND